MEISNNENGKTGTFSFLSGESGASPSQFRDGGSIGQLLQWDATAKQLPEFSMVQVKTQLFNEKNFKTSQCAKMMFCIQHFRIYGHTT